MGGSKADELLPWVRWAQKTLDPHPGHVYSDLLFAWSMMLRRAWHEPASGSAA